MLPKNVLDRIKREVSESRSPPEGVMLSIMFSLKVFDIECNCLENNRGDKFSFGWVFLKTKPPFSDELLDAVSSLYVGVPLYILNYFDFVCNIDYVVYKGNYFKI